MFCAEVHGISLGRTDTFMIWFNLLNHRQSSFLLCLPWSSTGPNSQDVETASPSIRGRMRKEDAVYTYNGILLSCGKEGNPATGDNVDGTWGHRAEWKQPDKYCIWTLSKLSLQGRRQDGGYQRGCGGTGAMRVPGSELTWRWAVLQIRHAASWLQSMIPDGRRQGSRDQLPTNPTYPRKLSNLRKHFEKKNLLSTSKRSKIITRERA